VTRCPYGHSVATLPNTRGVATLSFTHSQTVGSHATAVVAVPSTGHNPADYKIKYIISGEI
jgi:hypothetical protein